MSTSNRRDAILRRRERKRRIQLLKKIIWIICFIALAIYCIFEIDLRNIYKNYSERVFNENIGSAVQPKAYSEYELENKLFSLAQRSDKYNKIYEKRNDYPSDLLMAVCNNDEMLEFALNYLTAEKGANGEITDKELNADYPLLLQWDNRWGYAAYGESCIGLAGCAPTCLSMVYIYLTNNKEMTPDKIAEFSMRNGYYVENTGTSWALMTDGARDIGITGTELSLDEKIVLSQLESGHPIICSMRPGDFTTSGHFIVLAGTRDGKIIVSDPNSIARSNQLWDFDTLKGQIKNLWVYK